MASGRPAPLWRRRGRRGVDRFEDFGIDLGQHAAVGQAQRQHAGRRTEAEDADEDQRPDQFRNAAQDGQQAARDRVQGRLFAPGATRQVGQRHGEQEGQRHAGGGDGQRFQRRLAEVAEEFRTRLRRQEAGQEVSRSLSDCQPSNRAPGLTSAA
jgi:hypothetical protein